MQLSEPDACRHGLVITLVSGHKLHNKGAPQDERADVMPLILESPSRGFLNAD